MKAKTFRNVHESYVVIKERILTCKDISLEGMGLYLVLRLSKFRNGADVDKISKFCRENPKRVVKILKELKENGLITFE